MPRAVKPARVWVKQPVMWWWVKIPAASLAKRSNWEFPFLRKMILLNWLN